MIPIYNIWEHYQVHSMHLPSQNNNTYHLYDLKKIFWQQNAQIQATLNEVNILVNE